MNSFSPENDVEPEWREARCRVEAYLRALDLSDCEQQQRIISVVFQRAAAKHAQNPGESPTVLAMNEICELLEHWLQKVIQPSGHASATGFVPLFAIDAAQKWPAAFLAEEVPADFRQILEECEVLAAPDLKVSRMVPQPFENPLGAINLPSALGQLTKDMSPSLVARVVAFILSGFTFWSGNRMR
jgi:hypothetical protein